MKRACVSLAMPIGLCYCFLIPLTAGIGTSMKVGYSAQKKLPGDRLICIHHEDSLVPVKIDNIDAVPATRQHLIPFLHNLLCNQNPLPGMDAINHDAMIEPIAESLLIRCPGIRLHSGLNGPTTGIR